MEQSFFQNRVYNNFNKKIIDLYNGELDILDVGCGSGLLAREIKKINSNSSVYGIDISSAAKDEAIKFIDKFYLVDLDAQEDLEFNKKFDLIVFGDVLEHLKRPDVVLSAFKRFLKENGSVIISLPNVAYFRIRLRLLFGRFDYGDTGIMDRTHLKFFTYKTALGLIEKSGYLVDKRRYVFSRKLRFLNDDLVNKFACIFYNLFSIQFVFKIHAKHEDYFTTN